jgi:hypothetical protein
MIGMLPLLADFIDRLAAPSYGVAVNDEYAFRFAVATEGDAEFARQLADLELGSADLPSLTIDGWLWYLAWRRDVSAKVPEPDFLTALYDVTAQPIVRLRVVQEVTWHPSTKRAFAEIPAGHAVTLRELPAPWLGDQLLRATRPDREGEPAAEAIELANYLIQLGDEVSTRVLRALLSERWIGRRDLVTHVQTGLDALGEDPARGEWLHEVGLEPPPAD